MILKRNGDRVKREGREGEERERDGGGHRMNKKVFMWYYLTLLK